MDPTDEIQSGLASADAGAVWSVAVTKHNRYGTGPVSLCEPGNWQQAPWEAPCSPYGWLWTMLACPQRGLAWVASRRDSDVELVTTPIMPAVAIVDSRNVWGSFRKLFGRGRRVDVQGVRCAFRRFGFDVTKVYVAIGTQGPNHNRTSRLTSTLGQNEGYAARIAADPMGNVLHGRLVQRGQDVEEKLVDVQCAIQIARSAYEIAESRTKAQAILVLSEDMDLIPAYDFARDLGVRVFAASHATLDSRPDSPWLLLPEGSWKEIAGGQLPGRYVGSELRRQMAKACISGQPLMMTFKVRRHWKSNVLLDHNSGACAMWRCTPDCPHGHRPGDRHALYVVGLELDENDREFPIYSVSPAPAAQPGAFQRATLKAWRTPTRVEVQLADGSLRVLGASIGFGLPGMSLLVQEYTSGSQRGWRLVGALEARPPTPGWTNPTLPELARATSSASSPGARVRATLIRTQQEITLQPPGGETPKAGDTYAVSPIAHTQTATGVHVHAVAISSCLPS